MRGEGQTWKCPKCGRKQHCPIPAIEVQCSDKHPWAKMELVSGEPMQAKGKKVASGTRRKA